MKNQKLKIGVHILPALLTIGIILGCTSKPALEDLPEKLEKKEIVTEDDSFAEELSGAVGDYEDGTFTGSGTGYGGDIRVEVTVEDRQITEIRILDAARETDSFFGRAKAVIDDILRLQTWDVDVVSGATYSSNGIKAAVENALTGQTVKTERPKTTTSGNSSALKKVSYTAPSGGYKDGTYTGSAQGFGGTIGVSVTVSGGKITAVNVTSASGETASYLSSAKGVISRILSKQTPNVDTVSGATYSSNGIINAAKNALSKAGGASSGNRSSGGSTNNSPSGGSTAPVTPKVNNHYKDGTYSGVGEGYGGDIRVTVTVKNGQIIKVNIDSAADETAAYFNKAKTLTDRIIQQQTWKLDAVSGATYSSQGILEAVGDAMASADQKTAPKRDPVRTFRDGTYTGSGTGYRGSRIRVQVTIKNGRITAIEILEAEKEGKLYQRAAEGTVTSILNYQDWPVDSISGATFTSNGIKQAVAEALDQAEQAAAQPSPSAQPSAASTEPPQSDVKETVYSGTATVEPDADNAFSAYSITVNITVQTKDGQDSIINAEVVSDTNATNRRFLSNAWKAMKPLLMRGDVIDAVSGATCSAQGIWSAWQQASAKMGG